MADPLYLALDQGGHATRALVFRKDGVVVARAQVPVTFQESAPDRFEQDPEAIVASVHQAIAQVLHIMGPQEAAHIAAAGLATQRASLVCWDSRTGRGLSPVIGWQDRRAADLIAPYSGQAFTIRERTGLVLSAHYGAPKMRWCLDHLPGVEAAAKDGHLIMGPLASFLAFRLVIPQPLVVDPANASRTLLWNRHSCGWDRELLALFHIREEFLPNCTPSRYPFGALSLRGVRTPLTIMTGDQGAALFGEGAPRADTAYINIGTGAFLQRPIGRGAVEPGQLLISTALTDGHEITHVLEGTVNGAGAALDWGAANLPFAHLDERCAEVLADGTPRPLFVNAVAGLGSPYWRTDIQSRFEGDGSVTAKAAAIIESVLFLIYENLTAIIDQTGPLAALVVTGGLTRCDPLCQALADLTGCAIRRPAEHEATARGLAFLVAGRPAHWTQIGTEETFSPHADPGLSARHAHWRSLMPAYTP